MKMKNKYQERPGSHTSFQVQIPSPEKNTNPSFHQDTGTRTEQKDEDSQDSQKEETIDKRLMAIAVQQIKQAVAIIERTWMASRDRQIFKMLKHAVCAAENCLTSVFLQSVSPLEAQLVQDPAMPARVRLRFGGSTYPPLIYFKIFHHRSGPVVQYISGKNMIRASTEANEDSLRMKGNRIFYQHMVQDNIQRHNRITDVDEVITLKDYMQYLANLDETPAKYGGKSNFWRLLSLNDVPRHTIFYDIVEFLYNGNVSEDLQKELPRLLVKPVTQRIQLLHLKIISALRSPILPSLPHITKGPTVDPQQTKRRSKQARKRVSKMKELYEQQKENPEEMTSRETQRWPMSSSQVSKENTTGIVKSTNNTSPLGSCDQNGSAPNAHAAVDDDNDGEDDMSEWDGEAYQLYQWSRHLSVENIMSTPRLST